MSSTESAAPWWGVFEFAAGQTRRWEIGPSTLWISRYDHEWRVAHLQHDDPLLDRCRAGATASEDEIDEEAVSHRFALRSAGSELRIEPLLADRAVVIRPEMPFRVLSGEEVTLYVSTPLWLRLALGASGPKLIELPSYRPSDTWFGSSTIEGELCYASRTIGRLALEDLPARANRALTPVRCDNRGQDALQLERLKIPVQYLELYEAPGTLWTQSVVLTREESGDLAGLRFEPRPPPEAPDSPRVSPARQASEQNLVVRAFSKIFRSE